MARKKFEFRPDPTGFDVAGKMVLTQLQRQALWKWFLYSVLCVGGLIIQDSVLSRVSVLGGNVDLAPALIVLVCVVEGCEQGSLFALIASLIYVFSGTGQDRYCILYLTVCAVTAAALRQAYFRRGISSDLICVGCAMAVYEMIVFASGLFLELTHPGRWSVFAMTALVSTLAVGFVYKAVRAIGALGGDQWKE